MSMFCYQCQETAKNQGCTMRGVCGKIDETANLQDLLLFVLKGISFVGRKAAAYNLTDEHADEFIMESLFSTITNANFDDSYFIKNIGKAIEIRDSLKKRFFDAYQAKESKKYDVPLPDAAQWIANDAADYPAKASRVGILSTENEDIRSLRSMILFGVKGMSAYMHHAYMLGYKDQTIFDYTQRALAAMVDETVGGDDLFNLVVECGEFGVKVMALLDKANTETYGVPVPTQVETGVRKNPGILISGHDLKDLEELLIQTKNSGIDVYTHSEMLPAHYYPAFKKYAHLAGNYGGSWWHQPDEFEKFNGPVLLTTNCLVPPKDLYKDRVYVTGVVGFTGLKHIADRKDGQPKDFSSIIEHAKKCAPPVELENGTITGGFNHRTVLSMADTIIAAIKAGKIRKFIVMAGCDGRHKERQYYTDFAAALPKDTIILTAGCAKYRYNKLALGDIDGIPRVLDAGQCNDSYSLAVIALKLAEVLNVDVNELPIVYNIAWYEQKAVLVLLSLLSLGVKKIHLGPTLPGFLSPNVAKAVIEKFELGSISDVTGDIKSFIG